MHGRKFTFAALGLTPAIVAAAPGAAAPMPAVQGFPFHHAKVLGTAMDLTVVAANRDQADAVDKAMLAAITRLDKILSAYDPNSELSKLNTSPVNGPGVAVSPELIDVLRQYDHWFDKTGGAYNGHAGELIALWQQAEKTNQLPTDAALAEAARRCAAPAWAIDPDGKTVRRVSDQQINLDSLGKGYIIDKAVAAATKPPAKIQGLLLNIGGDLRTYGTPAAPAKLWQIGVTDPAHPALNAKPLTTIFVPGDRSVSSSGAYQRFYKVAGKQYSHILDARTGKPGHNPAATVVADDSAAANALATISCAMKFTEASELVHGTTGAESLVVLTDGTQVRTDGFKQLQDTATASGKGAGKMPVQFPAGFKLSVDLETAATQHRPYVFVWVTDSAGKYVKTLCAYGNDPKYIRDMREWSKATGGDRSLQSITHATQRSGKYPLTWDGTDQQGNGVPLGKYSIWVEVAAEHGPYACKSASITLDKDPADAKIAAANAFSEVPIRYGPGDKN